jgi:hypothetical protein
MGFNDKCKMKVIGICTPFIIFIMHFFGGVGGGWGINLSKNKQNKIILKFIQTSQLLKFDGIGIFANMHSSAFLQFYFSASILPLFPKKHNSVSKQNVCHIAPFKAYNRGA